MREPIEVTFLPASVTVTANAGDTVLDAALDNAIVLPHECGGNCTCTSCHVVIVAGASRLSTIEEAEAYRLQFAGDRTPDSRLACQALLHSGPVLVEIPYR